MPCNGNNPKANDPRYHCNERTNRWNLTRRRAVAAAHPLEAMTVRDLLRLPQARLIRGRYRMNKAELINRLRAAQNQPPAVVRPRRSQWSQRCKQLQQRCPSDTSLTADEWCSLRKEDVVYLADYSFCEGIRDIISLIHTALTGVSPYTRQPSLQLVRNPLNRQPLDIGLLIMVRDHCVDNDIRPEYPEVVFMLANLQAYNDALESTDGSETQRMMRFLATRIRGWRLRSRITNDGIVWSWARASPSGFDPTRAPIAFMRP